MATFPNIDPSYPVEKKSAPITRTVVFADGYQHRITFGLPQHQNPKIFAFVWKNLSETDSDTIETFLDARANDNDSFDYTPPNESSSMKFVCRKWSKSMEFSNLASIKATFEEVFEP
jgi:phage-related protein